MRGAEREANRRQETGNEDEIVSPIKYTKHIKTSLHAFSMHGSSVVCVMFGLCVANSEKLHSISPAIGWPLTRT
jgi:hypothetical protein